MKTILVPTDFSDAALNAAEYSVQLAKDIKAKVLLFHVYHLPIHVPEVPIMVTPSGLQQDNESELKKVAAHLSRKTGVEVNFLAKLGFAVDEILEEEKNVDLIIMGMKGANKLSEALIGSITTATLRKTKIPLMVIPEKVKYKKPETIVFACDHDPRIAGNTLDLIRDLLNTIGCKIYILNVKRKKESVSLVESLTKMEFKNTLNSVENIYYFPEKEDLVEGINEFVEAHHADIVVTIPHAYNLVERLFHKSISKKMAFHIHVPLLALPDNLKTTSSNFL